MSSTYPRLERPAWVEVDLAQLRRNFALIRAFTPSSVRLLSVVKAEAYGHGSVAVARAAVAAGASHLAVATPGEAAPLRAAGLTVPILLFGNPPPALFPACAALDLTLSPGDLETAAALEGYSRESGWCPSVQIKVNTGMNRYGFRWDAVDRWAPALQAMSAFRFAGIYSHFAMSDEADKSFAHEQRRRFGEVLEALNLRGFPVGLRHLCNTGGLLDLPEAHLDMVRLGILPLGVYPSKVCRRLAGLKPVMTVKALVTSLQTLETGETVGYGLKYRAASRRRVAILPLGYADGFPRVRNEGEVLIRGRRAPLVGGVAMDALTVDVTAIPDVALFDEAVVCGVQGVEEIAVDDLARLKGSVCYDILAGWRGRLPRVYRGDED